LTNVQVPILALIQQILFAKTSMVRLLAFLAEVHLVTLHTTSPKDVA